MSDPTLGEGIHPSPNIQSSPDVYEIENIAVDPEQRIEAAMRRVAPWDGKVVLDLGCGTGFHIPRFHQSAAHVIGVEPHGPSHLWAIARAASLGLERASVIRGSAAAIPLRDRSVDIVHARFAYFFAGPGCEPGLAELERVTRPGGTAFIIDNDLTGGAFATWLRRLPDWSHANPDSDEAFYAAHGFSTEHIRSEWRFENRADLEAAVRLEFPPSLAEELLSEHPGTRVEYWYALMHRTY